MSKRSKLHSNGRNRGLFLALPKSELDSEQFRRLTGAATKVTLAVAARYNLKNNGEIPFGERDGEKWGLSRHTVRRGLIEAQVKGTLIKTREGAFYAKRTVAEWALGWLPLPVGMIGIPVPSAKITRGNFEHHRGSLCPYAEPHTERERPIGAKSAPVRLISNGS